ncbi:MAG: hypothetical protein QY322_04790 [bacterium]|nr:MAG: hypothetical protein QY322_04790 [bacterium]
MTEESPKFKTKGLTLVECNIDPSTCPARKIRSNLYLSKVQYMCTHKNAPGVTDETLTYGGFVFRTCVTKDKSGYIMI